MTSPQSPSRQPQADLVAAATEVLAEMERHGSPDTRYHYGTKLRRALGATGDLECTCTVCVALRRGGRR